MTTKIYEVCYQHYDDFGTDSIWFSREKADARLAEIQAEQKKARRSRSRNVWGSWIPWEVVEHETEDEAPLVIPKAIFDLLDEADEDSDPAFGAGLGAAWHVLRNYCDHDYKPRVNGGSLCSKCRNWTPERLG